VWPTDAAQLEALQRQLAARWAAERPWLPPESRGLRVAAAFVATGSGASAWAAAVIFERGALVDSAVVAGRLEADYVPGLLAQREGKLLAEVVHQLRVLPDILIVNATGRDHPRGAGLALHLGAVLGLPTVGVTDRPLHASGGEPGPARGDTAELRLAGELVGFRVRTRASARALAVHAAWRTSPETARDLVLDVGGDGRTPEPLRQARRLARTARGSG